MVCARCLAGDLVDTALGPHGRLHTFTWVHVPLFGTRRAEVAGYGVGQVDLDEGPRVQAVLAIAREDLAVGMDLELQLETLRQTEDGDEVVIFRFGRPA